MASSAVLLIAGCFLLKAGYMSAYSTGPGPDACDYVAGSLSMTPGHNVSAQSSVSPYTVKIIGDIEDPRGFKQVIVELHTPSGLPRFKGFMLTAMDGNGALIGNFEVTNADQASLTTNRCSGTALTHNSGWSSDYATDRSLMATWTSPLKEDFSGYVTFLATFVQSREKFWVRVDGGQREIVYSMPAVIAPPPGWVPEEPSSPEEPSPTPQTYSLPAINTAPPSWVPSSDSTTTTIPTTTTTIQTTTTTQTTTTPLASSLPANVQEQTTKAKSDNGCAVTSVECLKRNIVTQIHYLIMDLEKLKSFISPSNIGSASSRN